MSHPTFTQNSCPFSLIVLKLLDPTRDYRAIKELTGNFERFLLTKKGGSTFKKNRKKGLKSTKKHVYKHKSFVAKRPPPCPSFMPQKRVFFVRKIPRNRVKL